MCTKYNHFLNLSLIKGSALKVCAGSPARQPSLFGCVLWTLTVDSRMQLSLAKQLAHLILGGLRSTSSVLLPSVPLCPQALRHSLLKVLCAYLVSCSVDQPVRRHSLYVLNLLNLSTFHIITFMFHFCNESRDLAFQLPGHI